MKRFVLCVFSMICFSHADLVALAQLYVSDVPSSQTAVQAESELVLVKHDSDSLPNLIQVTSEVFSGGIPQGELGFAELRKLNVKTLLSVDGMKPDVAGAKKFGLRYVHMPHGYDGISQERVRELAVALIDLPKPIYVHCHHGRHRSPTAVAAACVAIGKLNKDTATQLLEIAGTDKKYVGLYRTVAQAELLDKADLRSKPVEYVECADVPPTIDRMVAMDNILYQLTDGKMDSSAPTTKSLELASLLHEAYRELDRLEETQSRGTEYREILQEGIKLSLTLSESGPNRELPAMRWKERIAIVQRNCAKCHERFREQIGTKR